MPDSSPSDKIARLREPFPPHQIGKLPRRTRDGIINLDYVSHAWVTERLLDVDPDWHWEPLAFDDNGLPKIIINEHDDAVLWIRLTVLGMTKIGVGSVPAYVEVGPDRKRVPQHDLEKQLVSDAIRNAAMRFGVALECWAKETEGVEQPAATVDQPSKPQQATSRNLGTCAICNQEIQPNEALVRRQSNLVHVQCTSVKPAERGAYERGVEKARQAMGKSKVTREAQLLLDSIPDEEPF